MSTEEEETAAIEALDGAEWMGRDIKVNKAKPREDRPRRGGGGGRWRDRWRLPPRRLEFIIQQPLLAMLSGGGLGMAYPAEDGVSLFAVHYSINKPVPGVSPGDYNYDITAPTGEYFVHENRDVTLKVGDKVYYWIYVLHEGRGYQLTDQQWTAYVSTTEQTDPNEECEVYPCLIFEDNFDFLDFKTWQHEISMSGGGNWEFQYYTNNRSNSYTKDGLLYLKPTLTADNFGEAFLSSGTLDLWGMANPNLCTANAWYGCLRVGNPSNYINPIQSARIRTINSFNFRYGKVEVEAQMPKGDWIWPAIWMLPESEAYGGWPASGEIDLVESRGNLDLTSGGESKGNDNMGATLHWGPFWPYNGYEKTTAERHNDFGDSMHRYGLEWDENSIKLLLDDEVILNVEPTDGGFWELGDWGLPDTANPWRYANKMSPFDQPFYFIMNVAVGGTNGFFPDEWEANPPKPWTNQSPTAMKDFWDAKNNWYPTWSPDVNEGEGAAMKVNYIRVWKTKPDPE